MNKVYISLSDFLKYLVATEDKYETVADLQVISRGSLLTKKYPRYPAIAPSPSEGSKNAKTMQQPPKSRSIRLRPLHLLMHKRRIIPLLVIGRQPVQFKFLRIPSSRSLSFH